MKRDDQLEPMLTHYFKAQEGDHRHKKIIKKTGRDQSSNVTGRDTSTNDLSNEEPMLTEKKNPIFEPQQRNTKTC